ncbi:MAG TPA: aromatic ring-hydroxylating dioxygenase subunit alpha [Pseudonocardia sp.]|nr:aromatic ring-hydroxylating dioxygenase subunit alpha [Pseudonocardia sp.]
MTLTDESASMPRSPGSPLVDEDDAGYRFRVHRSTMTSPEVFQQELRRVFDHSWLYVGHESEVANPGDYVRRPVGGRNVFMVRGAKSKQVHVFHNTCSHRGAVVCRQKAGNAKVFQCFYHAWTFDSEGKLSGVPDREGYGAGLDFAALGLRSVAKVESYRGFVFASYDPDIVGLVDYLAGAAEYLDLVADSSETGMEVIKGTNEYCISANWKLLAENSVDGYHALPTHDTYFKYLVAKGLVFSGGLEGNAKDLGNGHAVMEYLAPWGRPTAKWGPDFDEDVRTEIDRLRAELIERHGERRGTRIADTNRNMLIYPNLVVNDIMAVTVRTFMPSGPGQMDVTAWQLAVRNEHPSVRQTRLDNFLTFLGPAGFATPDDVEALESCQQGFASGGIEWNDISRGMARDAKANDELQMRVFWRRWAEQMGSSEFTAMVTR